MGSGGAHLPCGPRQVTNPPEPTSRSPGGAPDPQPTPRPRKGSENKRTASALASPGGERAGAGRSGQTGISVLVQRLLPGVDSVSSPQTPPPRGVCTSLEHGTTEPTGPLPQGRAEAARPPKDRSSAPSFLRAVRTQALAPLTLLGSRLRETRSATPCSVAPARPDARGKGAWSAPRPFTRTPRRTLGTRRIPVSRSWRETVPPEQIGAWAEQPPHSPRAELGYAPNARGSPRCSLKATCHVLVSPGAGTPCLESHRKL